MNKKTNPGVPVLRKIYIYDLTNRNQTSSKAGIFYHDIKTRLVKTVMSDSIGNFSISLPNGTYSLFTEEQNGLFSNILDDHGNINPVEVKKGLYSNIRIRIDYKAVY